MSNMNARLREIAYCYLIPKDGKKCKRCKKTLQELEEEAYLDEIMTGRERKLPLLVVDCMDNSGDHSDLNNLQFLCWSCNRKKNPHKVGTSQSLGPIPSREKLDMLNFEPTYHRNLRNYLIDIEHICRVELRMASKNLSGGASEVTCNRYFESEVRTTANQKAKYQIFSCGCGSDHCNGNHVCLMGMKPERLLNSERTRLKYQWKDQYENYSEQEYNRLHHDRWIPEAEFINKNAILLNHRFY